MQQQLRPGLPSANSVAMGGVSRHVSPMARVPEQPTPLAPGEGFLLAGRYRVVRTLGSGESGRVLLARDQGAADREVAVKLVGAAHRERLGWEFQLLRKVSHPKLAQVHELLRWDAGGVSGEMALLVSEYVPGVSATQALGPEAKLSAAERTQVCLNVVYQAAMALCALHAAGFVHGDVKPDNLVVDGAWNAKLIDLGFSRAPGFYGEVGGSLGFMAPELFVGQVGFAADLYALGMTLLRLLQHGTASSDEGREPSLVEAWSSAQPRPHFGPWAWDGVLPAGLDPPLARLLSALLHADPAARPQTARTVVAQLGQLGAAGAGEAATIASALGTATASELCARATQLPLVGHEEVLRDIQDSLAQGESCLVVAGASGSGRTRLVRDAVADYQLRCTAVGKRAPTYLACERLPSALPEHDCVLHVQPGEAGITCEHAANFLAAAEVSQWALQLIIEQEQVLPGYPSCITATLTAADMVSLVDELLADEPLAAELGGLVFELSSGLSGRACRLLAGYFGAQHDKGEPAQLTASGLRALSPTAAPSPPGAALPLLDMLWLCGGQLSSQAVAALARAGAGEGTGAGPRLASVAAQSRLLLLSGFSRLAEDGSLRLRFCVALAPRPAGPRWGRAELLSLLELPEFDERSRAFLQLATGQADAAKESLPRLIAAHRRRGEVDAAAALAELAVSRLPDGETRRRLVRAQADALRAQGAYPRALSLLAPQVAEDADSTLLAAELLRLTGRATAAEEHCQRLIGAHVADGTVVAAARLCLARLAVDRGDGVRALVLVDEAGSAGMKELVSALRAVEVRALCAVQAGDVDGAAAVVGAALRGLAGEEGADAADVRPAREQLALSRLHALAAYVAAAGGSARDSLQHNRKAAALAAALGEVHGAAVAQANAGSEALEQGQLGRACVDLRHAAIALSRLGRDADVWPALHNLAHALLRIADFDGASALLQPAQAAGARSGQREAVPLLGSLEAELLWATGRLGAARQALATCGLAPEAPPHVRIVVLSRLLEVAIGIEEHARIEPLWVALRAVAAEEEEWQGEHLLCAARVAASDGHADALALGQQAFAAAQSEGQFDVRLRSALFVAHCAHERGEEELSRRFLGEARGLLERAAIDLPQAAVARMRAAPAYQAAFRTKTARPTIIEPDQGQRLMQRLLAASRRFVGERRLSRLSELVLDAALELSSAERGYLLTVGPAGAPVVRAARGLSSASVPRASEQLSASIAGRVLATGQPLSTTDALTDERLSSAKSVHALMLRSVVALPLSFSGEVRGVIYLEDRLRPAAFPAELIPWLLDLAGLAAPAIEAAMVVREQRRTLRRLSVARARLAQTVQAQAVELQSLRDQVGGSADQSDGLLGRSPALRAVLDMARRVARSDLPVLIQGESGTGKELLARAIHRRSPRAERPFVVENCSAVPEGLLESTLFGHVRGAFTGAERPRRGLFELADRGTLFLDEVGEMSPAMQVRLLRVLQDGVIRPVGAERDLRVNVRLVAATHRDVPQMVADGVFREDLFYRLSVVQLKLPPLRERVEDIPELVAHLVARHGDGRRIRIAPAALRALATYPWPGNVRQLENEVRRALLLVSEVIEKDHLSPAVTGQDDRAGEVLDTLDLHSQVAALSRRLVRQALEQAAGNQTQAAKMLGVSRYGLQKMIRRLALP